MAKVAFTKLALTKNTLSHAFNWNGQSIEVKQYLPIQDKVEIIVNVLNNCQDGNNFINQARFDMYFDLEMIYKYTNISFTEKQKEETAKTYDLLKGSGLIDETLKNHLNGEEYSLVRSWAEITAAHMYEYRNSVYGILDAIGTDYSNLSLDAEALKNEIADPNSLTLLKDVLTKLG